MADVGVIEHVQVHRLIQSCFLGCMSIARGGREMRMRYVDIDIQEEMPVFVKYLAGR